MRHGLAFLLVVFVIGSKVDILSMHKVLLSVIENEPEAVNLIFKKALSA
ncbi:hypothetical protein ACRPOS_001800 [Bartonella heixiaziensis]